MILIGEECVYPNDKYIEVFADLDTLTKEEQEALNNGTEEQG